MTFSDWLSIATLSVTLVGYYIWYLVFVLQAKTLDEQQKITKLSLSKYIYDIRPNFLLIYVFEQYRDAGTPSNFDEFHYDITLEKNIAFDFRIEVKTDFLKKSRYLKRNIKVIQIGEKFDLINDAIERKYSDQEVEVYIYFKDEAGTEYYQLLHGDLYDLRLDPPIKTEFLKERQ